MSETSEKMRKSNFQVEKLFYIYPSFYLLVSYFLTFICTTNKKKNLVFDLTPSYSSESGHHDWNVGPWEKLKIDDMNSPIYKTNLENATIIYVSERVGSKN